MAIATVTDIKELPVVLTVEQVQKILGLSRPKTYELVHTKGFPRVQIGRSIRVPREALLQWLAEQQGVNASVTQG
jgi:excisionase family DNA binding protein